MDKVLKGQLFIVDEFEYIQGTDLEKEFDKIEFYEEYALTKGSIVAEANSKNLRFNIELGKEFQGSHFVGDLHVDQTIMGEIEYGTDTHTSKSQVSGHYKITKNNGIIIAGIWEYPDGIKEYCWIELA